MTKLTVTAPTLTTSGSDVKGNSEFTTDDPLTVDETLKQRGARYGSFVTHAQYAEQINNIYITSPNWANMNADNKEALRIIANKIGRILNGDPEYDDNWRDIAGYATLVEKRINGTNI